MENTIKERVRVFCLYKKIPVSKFESECGLSNAYISSMRKGFGSDKLNNVLKRFPELNRDWLLYGEGEMLKGQPITAINNGTNNGNIIGYNKGGVSNNSNNSNEKKEEEEDISVKECLSMLKDAIGNNNELIEEIRQQNKRNNELTDFILNNFNK